MSRRTVLIVEDDPRLRLDASSMLVEAGLDVVEMDNADDALAYTYERSDNVAAIFTDIQMPGHSDGLHLAFTVARHWPHILVIICSGYVRPIDPLPGNVLFVEKPWRPLDVIARMQNAIAAS